MAVTSAADLRARSIDDDLIRALQALAEPTRARIVAFLGHGEHCVCDVGETLGLSPALVSHHLRTLSGAGLLRERKAGRWVYYSLDLQALEVLRGSLNAFLTPSDETAASCVCSDCGSERDAGRYEGLRGLEVPTAGTP